MSNNFVFVCFDIVNRFSALLMSEKETLIPILYSIPKPETLLPDLC